MIDRRQLLDRRQFLSHSAGGFGAVALAHLLSSDGLLAKERESPAG